MTQDQQTLASSELFHRVGVTLFGDRYAGPLAVLLEVDQMRVRTMASGHRDISPTTWQRIRSELERRHQEWARLTVDLNTALGPSPEPPEYARERWRI